MELLKSVRLLSNVMFFRLKHGNPSEVDRHWENYWKTIDRTGTGGEVLWDSNPERASANDLALFSPRIADPSLPMLDFGCGNGRQTRYLARHFERVVGTDVAPSAIELARRETVDELNVLYRVVDGLRPEEARALHREFGDMNVYVRTVLHVLQKKDRPKFVESLAILLGEKGTLYQIELALCALDYFRTLPGDSPSGLPRHVHQVIRTGATSVGFDPKERPGLFPEDRWDVLDAGDSTTIVTVPLSHGQEGMVPAHYFILRPRRNGLA